MLYRPPIPDVPEAQRATGRGYLRYEDVCQDGRVNLTALPHTVGLVVWHRLLNQHPITTALRPRGIIPVLSRTVLEGAPGRVPATRPIEGSGGFQLAHAPVTDGPPRLMLNLWVTLKGHAGRTHEPRPEPSALVGVGRVWAEHVLTRPFASPDQRRVHALDAPGLPAVPPAQCVWRPPHAALVLPDGAAPLADWTAGEVIAFGLDDTDSNQHVNSLIYPRRFCNAALAQLSAIGHDTRVLARYAEIAYRKPCFAGDRARWLLRPFSLGDQVGVVGCLVLADADTDALLEALAADPVGVRAHCYAMMVFSP